MTAPLRQVVRRRRTGPGQLYAVEMDCGHSLGGLTWNHANVARKRCLECQIEASRDLVGLVRAAEPALRIQYASRADREEPFEEFVAGRLVEALLVAPDTDVPAVVREALGEGVAAGA
jgi:hypothetical protein